MLLHEVEEGRMVGSGKADDVVMGQELLNGNLSPCQTTGSKEPARIWLDPRARRQAHWWSPLCVGLWLLWVLISGPLP